MSCCYLLRLFHFQAMVERCISLLKHKPCKFYSVYIIHLSLKTGKLLCCNTRLNRGCALKSNILPIHDGVLRADPFNPNQSPFWQVASPAPTNVSPFLQPKLAFELVSIETDALISCFHCQISQLGLGFEIVMVMRILIRDNRIQKMFKLKNSWFFLLNYNFQN